MHIELHTYTSGLLGNPVKWELLFIVYLDF